MPVCITPFLKSTLRLEPLGNGVPKVTVSVEFSPPPIGWAGGVSSVTPLTVTMHGGVGEPGSAAQVAVSVTPPTDMSVEVIARRSAVPVGDGNVVNSTIRKRSRVTGDPVLFTTRRRLEIVPNAATLGSPGVVFRFRLGSAAIDLVVSSNGTGIVASRFSGDEMFSGPAAPKRGGGPADVPFGSANMKSIALLFVSFGVPGVVQPFTKSHNFRK